MHIAVVGCGHGEIDKIYEVIDSIETQRNIKVSLVLCCGDFQSVRNITDLRCMACPIKYQQMHDFHRYYSGEKKAPILTIFIGGNHEASNFLQELPYGGWVAPNIFYLGYVGVLKYGHVRIAGISGIYKGQDYLKGRFEVPPYNQGTMRSVYHYRNIDTFRLKQLQQHVDVIISHDWPKGIHQFGNTHQLLRRKPFFREEIERNELGSRPLSEVLEKIKPGLWFSAHMHVKFAAYVKHNEQADNSSSEKQAEATNLETLKVTKFLALDKVLPRRQFLQIIEIPSPSTEQEESKLCYDPEWLAILKSTDHLISIKEKPYFMPGPGGNSRYDFSPSETELEAVIELFDKELVIPHNFVQTAKIFCPEDAPQPAFPVSNSQTTEFCQRLNIRDPLKEILDSNINNPLLLDTNSPGSQSSFPEFDNTFNTTALLENSANPDEISLDLDDDESNDADREPILPIATSSRTKLVLPPPKSSTTENADELADDETPVGATSAEIELLRSVMGNTEDSEQPLFFIDTEGSREPEFKRRKDSKR